LGGRSLTNLKTLELVLDKFKILNLKNFASSSLITSKICGYVPYKFKTTTTLVEGP